LKHNVARMLGLTGRGFAFAIVAVCAVAAALSLATLVRLALDFLSEWGKSGRASELLNEATEPFAILLLCVGVGGGVGLYLVLSHDEKKLRKEHARKLEEKAEKEKQAWYNYHGK